MVAVPLPMSAPAESNAATPWSLTTIAPFPDVYVMFSLPELLIVPVIDPPLPSVPETWPLELITTSKFVPFPLLPV
jgi:hypothetical protein